MAAVSFGNVAPVFPVDDVERALAWYETVLGFQSIYVNRDTEGKGPTNYAVLGREDAWLHLLRRSEPELGVPEHLAFYRKLQVATAQFSVTEVDALFKTLAGKGVRVVRGLANQPWGARDFTIEDPDGNWVWISKPL